MIKFYDEPGLIMPRGEGVKADVAITTFSDYIYRLLLERANAKQAGVCKGSVDIPLYTCDLGGKTALIYRTPVGAPAAVSALEEVMACGVKKVIAFGICGALVDIPPHEIVVPTVAFRDEGTSYHYLPAADSIAVKNANVVNSSLNGNGVKTITGGVWTTDGFYRETRTRAEEMKKNGCVAVDMECAALQACADFRGNEFYTFFITADSLAGEEWEPNYLLDLVATDSTSVAVAAALKLAKELIKN